MTPEELDQYTRALARLAVRFGANVQPGQIVGLSSTPGKEDTARAVAEEAYAAGARFVDLSVFDVHLKRARVLHADRDSLGYIPPWHGERLLALGREQAARIALTGPAAPYALEGLDPELIALDMFPRTPEGMRVVNDRSTNWCGVPGPTREWAMFVHPRLEPEAAFERLWGELAHVLRLDEPDPVAAWRSRFETLLRVAATLTERRFDAIRLTGPGTDLTVGLLGSSHWVSAELETAWGLTHRANLPTEEVFTTPDPERVDGVVTATKPLFTSGALITGLRVRFEAGRAVSIEAEENGEVLRGLAAHDDGAGRLGELALVDGEGRIGPLGTVFYDTLLDENAASHIALGAGYQAGIDDDADRDRVNASTIHVDFMIGSDEVDVDGLAADGTAVPLLRGGRWQI